MTYIRNSRLVKLSDEFVTDLSQLFSYETLSRSKRPFNNYVDKMREGSKKSVFIHDQGIKTVHAGGALKVRIF